MPDERDVERTTVTDTPDERQTLHETRPASVRTGSNAGWWIAAIVAIVAIVGVLVLFNNQGRQDELQAARSQGAAEANIAAATSGAQRAAEQASQSAQAAVDSTARTSQRAAEAAQAAANQTAQTAQSAGDAARDTAGAEPAQPAPAPAQ